MRYVGAVSWLFATVVLLLAVGTAAGQVGDNVLVQGSPYGALSGVTFDDSDWLHVSRRWHSTLIMDPETGSLAGEFDELCAENDRCVWPVDLTFGPDGSSYWAGAMNSGGPDGFLYGPIWTEDRKRTEP